MPYKKYINHEGTGMGIKSFQLTEDNWLDFHKHFDGFSISRCQYASEPSLARYTVFRIPTVKEPDKPEEHFGIRIQTISGDYAIGNEANVQVGDIVYQIKGATNIRIVSEEEFRDRFTEKEENR